MVNYGLKDKVTLITGANNPQGIGATTAFANRQMMILYDTNDMGCWNDWRECYLLQKCDKRL